MTLTLKGLQLHNEENIWNSHRGVEVSSLDIVHGTLKSGGILNYTIKPTYADHDFMQQSGYTQYLFETVVQKVQELDGGKVEIATDTIALTVSMDEKQLNEWKEFAGSHIPFYDTNGEKFEKVEDMGWLFD